MEPVREAEEISNIAFGYIASKALFAALHIDIFTLLSKGPLNAADLANKTSVPENRITTLVTVLLSLGLLTKAGDCFENSTGAARFLSKDAKYDFGDYLRYQIDRQMFPFMADLEAVMTGDTAPDAIDSYSKWMADPAEAKLYSDSQHAGSLGPARSLVRMLDLNGAKTMLDVAGGTGAFAITLCKASPALQATIVDFPNVAALGEKYVADAGLSDRIKFVPGDALHGDWPHERDIVLMSYLFSGVPGEAIPTLVKRAFDALNPGGRYIVHDFIVNDDRVGPPLTALWQLQHLAFTPDARSVTPGWLSGVLTECGFIDITTDDLIPGMTRVMMARKPAS
ncbi:MAG: methyltransferase domain-containing protein [Alphaproteobacteria bacterium]|nr:methyltransferase domain-containing protein [Alphaproteobacteria bacterium]